MDDRLKGTPPDLATSQQSLIADKGGNPSGCHEKDNQGFESDESPLPGSSPPPPLPGAGNAEIVRRHDGDTITDASTKAESGSEPQTSLTSRENPDGVSINVLSECDRLDSVEADDVLKRDSLNVGEEDDVQNDGGLFSASVTDVASQDSLDRDGGEGVEDGHQPDSATRLSQVEVTEGCGGKDTSAPASTASRSVMGRDDDSSEKRKDASSIHGRLEGAKASTLSFSTVAEGKMKRETGALKGMDHRKRGCDKGEDIQLSVLRQKPRNQDKARSASFQAPVQRSISEINRLLETKLPRCDDATWRRIQMSLFKNEYGE